MLSLFHGQHRSLSLCPRKICLLGLFVMQSRDPVASCTQFHFMFLIYILFLYPSIRALRQCLSDCLMKLYGSYVFSQNLFKQRRLFSDSAALVRHGVIDLWFPIYFQFTPFSLKEELSLQRPYFPLCQRSTWLDTYVLFSCFRCFYPEGLSSNASIQHHKQYGVFNVAQGHWHVNASTYRDYFLATVWQTF